MNYWFGPKPRLSSLNLKKPGLRLVAGSKDIPGQSLIGSVPRGNGRGINHRYHHGDPVR